MPAKNALKTYIEDGYYHLYNRGVNKQPIFYDEQDYAVFISYLKTYLLPKNEKQLREIISSSTNGWREKDQAIKLMHLNNFSDEISLLAYCLMPNHYHLLIKQKSKESIDKFMSSIGTRYTTFFNKKYKRLGPLCQAVYKAVIMDSDEQLLYLTSYIHRNPLPNNLASQGESLRSYLSQPSSLPEYLGQRKTTWIHSEEILSYFSKKNPRLDYQSFVEQTKDFSLIKNAAIDF